MKKLFLLVVVFGFLTVCATSPVTKNITLNGNHGKLSAVLQTPKDKKTYPLVIIAHGFNASKEMYLLTNFASFVNKKLPII